MGFFFQAVAFGIEDIINVITKTVGNSGQASGIVVAEGQGGGVRCPKSRGDGFDFASGQIRPFCNSCLVAASFC